MSTDVSFDDESSLCDQNPLSDHDILADPQPGPGEVEIDTTISHDTTQNIDILLEQMDDILQIGTARDDLDTTIMLPHYPIPTLEAAEKPHIDDSHEEDQEEDTSNSFAHRETNFKLKHPTFASFQGPISLKAAEELQKSFSLLSSDQGPYARTLDFFLATISKLESENSLLKRRLGESTDHTFAQETDGESSTEHQLMAHSEMPAEDKPHNATPLIFETVHIVVHADDVRSYYRDSPRKFKGDSVKDRFCLNAKDHLRGREELENGSSYLDRNPRTAFLVNYRYSCNDFMKDEVYSRQGRKGAQLIRDTIPGEMELQDIGLSAPLDDALRAIIREHPTRFKNIKKEKLKWIPRPYLLFYWHIEDFRELVTKSGLEEDDCARVTLLCNWLEENYRKNWAEADELISRGKINEKHFSKLFRPGEIVVVKSDDSHVQFTARKIGQYPWTDQEDKSVDMHSWMFNGSFHKAKSQTAKRQELNKEDDEEVDITSLEIHPIRFASQDTFSKLAARGEKFWKYHTKAVACYRNPEFREHQQSQSIARYIVDYETFKRIHPSNEMFQFFANDEQIKEIAEITESGNMPDEEFLAILPAKILAFSFLTKEWKWLYVEYLTDVTWNKDAFEHLVVPTDTKDLIKALVRAQNNPSSAPHDIIAGKGNGLLMLLHGPPGTGKTLTAESIAEFEEKPLYRVTGGDVGLTPSAVERYLGKVFELGKAWGCVVLLDEADVFIEARGIERLERNALISVFLRVLEYYDGILILTTNRVGTFDEAFKSRIQLALSYPKLDRDQRRKIWQNFFNMIREYRERINIQDLEMNIEELADVDINGRQIRNALTTARHLADFKKERLVYGHLKLTIAKIQKFDEYIKEVQYDNEGGGYLDDETVARHLRLR